MKLHCCNVVKSQPVRAWLAAFFVFGWGIPSFIVADNEFPKRWQLDGDHGLVCVLDGTDSFKARPNVDFVTHGHRVIMRVSMPVDDGAAEVLHGPRVQWPIFKKGVRDRDLAIPGAGTRKSDLPAITVRGSPFKPGRRRCYKYDGVFSVVYEASGGIEAVRSYFPSVDKRIAFQEWRLKNNGKDRVQVDVPSVCERIRKRKAVDDREWRVDYVVTPLTAFELAPGSAVSFGVAYSAYPANAEAPEFDLKKEKRAYLAVLSHADGHLDLSTPDKLLNRAFHLAKVRTMLSNIETRAGLLNTTGSMAYYCGFWANDNAEYASPFIPLLGSSDLDDGLNTMYRVWLKDIKKYQVEKMAITGSFETYNLIPYQRGRGDESMILYGLSRYLLLKGEKELTLEMWPLLERCVDYVERYRNEKGVIASRTDELEGRLPTGSANLSTSALAYDGLRCTSRLAASLEKRAAADRCNRLADALERSIESFFGAQVEGFETYRYYEGNDKLRGWISLPVVAGITRRREQTLDALFSDKLWLEDAADNNVNLKALSTQPNTHWSRETYYALLAAYKGGRTELATEKLHKALGSHILGAGGPVADEDSIDLLAPTILFSRVVTEGLFGIEPVDFQSFSCKPRLPRNWPSMELRSVTILGEILDLHVRRSADDRIRLTVKKEGGTIYANTSSKGTTFRVKVKL